MFGALIVTLFSFPIEFLYWIKWILAYATIRFHNAFRVKRFDLYKPDADGDPVKLGYLIPQTEIDLESPQSEEYLIEGRDEIFFYGVNSKAECLLVKITRGLNQTAEAWVYLKTANGKTYHLSEHANYQQPFEDKCLNFSCGNMQMHYILPMRRWRIHYCGPLKEVSENETTPERIVFVKFVFLWSASSDVYDMTLNANPSGYASAVAKAKWARPFIPPISEVSETIDFYAQIGIVRGTVLIEDAEDYEMHLFGEKIRSLGKSSNLSDFNFQEFLGYLPQNGYGLHLVKSSSIKLFKNLVSGFVLKPDANLNVIQDLDIKIVGSSNDFEANIISGEANDISGKILSEPIVLACSIGWNGISEIFFVSFTFKNKSGYGLLISGNSCNTQKEEPKPVFRTLFPKIVPYVVMFTDEVSCFGAISGGKGSSLAKLTKLSRTDKTFTVPKGIIVTTSAYETFLSQDVIKSIKNLEDITYGKVEGNVKEACDIVSKIIVDTPIQSELCQSIISNLSLVFGQEFRDCKFAVRSSATGEDTEVMSAAGQMDTFLGVQSLEDIYLAIKKCWASQFGYIAVEYKRQNGQLLNSPMAVVIQEMVECDVAGVTFTCDPLNGNPNIITITANYGLGETVVSGSVEPDTFVIEKVTDDNLQIKSITIGSKHQKIVLNETGGTVTEEVPEDSKTNSCISNEMAEKLAELAIKVEKFYHSSRDIEWGILNNSIYLLQSRPVTNAAPLTDFEMKHEFDGVIRSERDYFTNANCGEVMPGAVSPLGMNLIAKFFNTAMAKESFKNDQEVSFGKCKYFPDLMQYFYSQSMMSVSFLLGYQDFESMFCKGFMISIFGRVLEEPEIYEVIRETIPGPPPATVKGFIHFVKGLFFYGKDVSKIKKQLDNYKFPFLKYKTAEETFNSLMKICSDFDEGAVHHIQCSGSSSIWNTIIFLILVKAKGRFDTDVYSDFGRILAMSSNLESADVPSSMQKLANQIAKDMGTERFKSMSLEEAEKWLTTSNTTAGKDYRQFISRHGHRCIKECDVYSIPWGQDPKNLIKSLQTLAGYAKEVTNRTDENYSKIFSELLVPLSFWDKICLRLAIPFCRRAVGVREYSKSLTVKGFSYWRIGIQHLAKQMVSEGFIPDAELIYFMTFEEIKTLIKTRFPKIIARANHRRKWYPILNEYKFPEISRGHPKPINEVDSTDSLEFKPDLTMQGIPVSQGMIKGYARVATSLDEAAHLKPGEILIAYATDIGWSPYFPIISGVVTELGGLISHGAVVSREYGLPCVVGLKGATKLFKTGDYVLLDGKKGILQKLPTPQQD